MSLGKSVTNNVILSKMLIFFDRLLLIGPRMRSAFLYETKLLDNRKCDAAQAETPRANFDTMIKAFVFFFCCFSAGLQLQKQPETQQ